MKKGSDEKSNEQANSDIHGRIEYIDQSLRSVDNRMRAVEKRLSIKTIEPDAGNTHLEKEINHDDFSLNEIGEKLHEMDSRLIHFEKKTEQNHIKDFDSLKSQLSLIENRILKLENHNKITIGKIKVPIEFSGLAATLVMFATAYLVYSDQWNIIRSSSFSIAIGLLFGAVVVGKFIMTNKE